MKKLLSLGANPNGYKTVRDVEHAVALASGVVKIVVGVANGVAMISVGNSLDRVKKSRYFRHRIKSAWREVEKVRMQYRSALIYPPAGEMRFFHVDDMPENTRRRYGNISDADYFEFWECTGEQCYAENEAFISSLANKYRKSFLSHGVPDAELKGHLASTAALLNISITAFKWSVKDVAAAYGLPEKWLYDIYKPFCLQPVFDKWTNALDLTSPETDNYDLDEIEERDIAYGIDTLEIRIINPKKIFESIGFTAGQFGDLYATKGQMKKTQREIAEMAASADENTK